MRKLITATITLPDSMPTAAMEAIRSDVAFATLGALRPYLAAGPLPAGCTLTVASEVQPPPARTRRDRIDAMIARGEALAASAREDRHANHLVQVWIDAVQP
jgi:hypothetical protein